MLELQRQAGRDTFLVAARTETTEVLAAAAVSIAVDQVISVLLSVRADVAAARIDAREPDTWPSKRRLIEHARRLAISCRGSQVSTSASIQSTAVPSTSR